jgi:hypothetical protein
MSRVPRRPWWSRIGRIYITFIATIIWVTSVTFIAFVTTIARRATIIYNFRLFSIL